MYMIETILKNIYSTLAQERAFACYPLKFRVAAFLSVSSFHSMHTGRYKHTIGRFETPVFLRQECKIYAGLVWKHFQLYKYIYITFYLCIYAYL
jgi:hypothetical protein